MRRHGIAPWQQKDYVKAPAACRQKTIGETAKNPIRVNYDAYHAWVEQRRQPATNIPARQNELTGETVKRLTPLRLAAQMCREPACKVSQEPLIRRHRLKHAATSAHTRLPQSKRPMAINARVSGHTTHESLPYGKDQRARKQPISDFIDAFAQA
jgi:hypothetical protein